MKYDIFISYRREGGYDTAKHLYDMLTRDGYNVSFDIDTLRSGDFDEQLLKRIDECQDFVVVFNKTALDRCLDKSVDRKSDWLRNELAHALKTNKNVIPILASDFEFPDNLPEDIAQVSKKNGVPYNKQDFDAMYRKIKDFLSSRPKRKIRKVLTIVFFVLLLLSFFFIYYFLKEL